MTDSIHSIMKDLRKAVDKGTAVYFAPDAVDALEAALAQPAPPAEATEPTFEQLYDLCEEFDGEPVESMRAALARWGNLSQPAPPAEGEVAELVAHIRQIAAAWKPDVCLLGNMTARQLTRAANLLERQQSVPVSERQQPVPVPVSERLPESGDCNEDGDCWWLDAHGWGWYMDSFQGNYGHWLPANALPSPRSEND